MVNMVKEQLMLQWKYKVTDNTGQKKNFKATDNM